MNLKNLSDKDLLFSCAQAVAFERRALLPVLKHFMEIDRRRLVKIFEHATAVLKYAEDDARKREWAMHFLREFPHAEPSIESGALNLTLILLLRSAFQRKKLPREEQIALIEKVSGRSTRAASHILAGEAALPAQKDSIRALNAEEVSVRFTANKRIREKLEVFRGRIAHTDPHASLGEIFEMLLDSGIEARNKAEKSAKPRNSKAAEHRAVFTKANSRCVKCGSTYALEKDHRIPSALGGPDEPGNYRALCRWCNQQAAVQAFGAEKMEPYLKTAAQRFSSSGK